VESFATATRAGQDEEERWDAVEAVGRQLARTRNPFMSEMRRNVAADLRARRSDESVNSVVESAFTSMVLALGGMPVSSEGTSELLRAMGLYRAFDALEMTTLDVDDFEADVGREMATADMTDLKSHLDAASWDDVCAARAHVMAMFDAVAAELPRIEEVVPGAFGFPYFLDPSRRPIAVVTHTLLRLRTGVAIDASV
jgi:hypothetical protein